MTAKSIYHDGDVIAIGVHGNGLAHVQAVVGDTDDDTESENAKASGTTAATVIEAGVLPADVQIVSRCVVICSHAHSHV